MKMIYTIKNSNDINKAIFKMSSIINDLGFHKFEVSRIALAISEIATNTIKHANGGIVQFGVLPKKNGIEIVIEDFGNGIEDIEKAKQKSYSTVKGSLGLGLHITEKIIDEFNIYSKLGEGTKVTIKHFLPISTEKIEYGISRIIDKNHFYSCNKYIKEELNGDTVLVGIIYGNLKNKEISKIIDDIRHVIILNKRRKLKDIIMKCNELIKKTKYIENLHYGISLLKPDKIEYACFGKTFIKVIDFESEIELTNQFRVVSEKTIEDLNIKKLEICDKVIVMLSSFDYKYNVLNIETSDSPQKISEIINYGVSNDYMGSMVLVLKRKECV